MSRIARSRRHARSAAHMECRCGAAIGARRVSGTAQAKPLALGPVVCGTVVCPSLPDAIERYAALDLRCVREGRISAETAAR